MTTKSPLRAIHAKCLDCSSDSANEAKMCHCTGCALYPFRFGKNPFRTPRVLSEDQKAAVRERLTAARMKKRARIETGDTTCLRR